MIKNFILLSFLILLIGIQFLSAQAYTAKVNFGQEKLAIRELRRNAITGNIGWNGLTGFGVTYHNYVAKQMGAEFGVGVATTGIKFGGRFSYMFSEKNFSPFVSAGFMYGLGTGDYEYDYELDGSYHYSYKIGASPFAQITGGIEYINNNGFMFSVNLGWAILLTDTNYEITKGNPTIDELKAMDIALSSGFVFEFSIGYALSNKKLIRVC